MPSKKHQKEKDDEARNAGSFGMVLVSAALSLFLGIILGVVNLATMPVNEVREYPPEEDRKPQTVYFVQGQERGGESYRAKEAALMQARPGSLSFNEAELNTWSRNTFNFGAPVPGENESGFVSVTPTSPRFSIRDGVMNVSMTMEVEAFGKSKKVLVHSDGEFVNQGGTWVFVPSKAYIGSAPMPPAGVSPMVMDKMLALFEESEIYSPLYNSWTGLSDVQVEGDELVLTR